MDAEEIRPEAGKSPANIVFILHAEYGDLNYHGILSADAHSAYKLWLFISKVIIY